MPHWKTTVELGDIHEAHQDGTMTTAKVAEELAKRIRKNEFASVLEDQLEELDMLAGTEITDDWTKDDAVAQYDSILQDLYDFGDANHDIWFNSLRSLRNIPDAPQTDDDNICHVSLGVDGVDCPNLPLPGKVLCSEHFSTGGAS